VVTKSEMIYESHGFVEDFNMGSIIFVKIISQAIERYKIILPMFKCHTNLWLPLIFSIVIETI